MQNKNANIELIIRFILILLKILLLFLSNFYNKTTMGRSFVLLFRTSPAPVLRGVIVMGHGTHLSFHISRGWTVPEGPFYYINAPEWKTLT